MPLSRNSMAKGSCSAEQRLYRVVVGQSPVHHPAALFCGEGKPISGAERGIGTT